MATSLTMIEDLESPHFGVIGVEFLPVELEDAELVLCMGCLRLEFVCDMHPRHSTLCCPCGDRHECEQEESTERLAPVEVMEPYDIARDWNLWEAHR